MPANALNLTEIIDKDVFTEKGAYCGKTRDIEIDLPKFKVRAIVVDAARGSYLAKKVGGKKGVIIPYSMVNSIEDVIMIRHFSGDVAKEDEEDEEELYSKEKVEEEEETV